MVGKRVVVTRGTEQAEELCRLLEERGARPVRCPTIRIAEPASWGGIDEALGRVASYDWVLFTSANGVRFTLERLKALGIGPGGLAGARVAAVGPRTALELRERGVAVAYEVAGEGSTALAASLPDVVGARVLMARSDRASAEAAPRLRARGARSVDDVVAYRTVPEGPSGPALVELRRGFQAITFTSPSTVLGFFGLGSEAQSLVSNAVIATLGPTTTAAVLGAGLDAEEADEKSMPGLARALERGFARRL